MVPYAIKAAFPSRNHYKHHHNKQLRPYTTKHTFKTTFKYHLNTIKTLRKNKIPQP